jgi:hypothetical protein
MKLWDRIFGKGEGASAAELEVLDRRAFMVGMTVTAAGLLVPKPTLFLPSKRVRRIISDDFEIDTVSRTIRYAGDADRMYTVGELYEYLINEWDRDLVMESTAPMARMSDQIVQLRGGYEIDDGTATHLYGGALVTSTSSASFTHSIRGRRRSANLGRGRAHHRRRISCGLARLL